MCIYIYIYIEREIYRERDIDMYVYIYIYTHIYSYTICIIIIIIGGRRASWEEARQDGGAASARKLDNSGCHVKKLDRRGRRV